MPEFEIPDLTEMTTAQRAVVALEFVPALMEEAQVRRKPRTGPGRPESPTGKAAAKAAKLVGVGKTSVETVVAIQKRDLRVIERMRAGELNIAQGARAAGLMGRGAVQDSAFRVAERDSLGREVPLTYYGKGDKWKEAAGPLLRYLSAWERRDYEFRHVAPKEARRRLALIEELQEKLDAARQDLEQRAHSATLTIRKKKG